MNKRYNELLIHNWWKDESKIFDSPLTTLNLNGDRMNEEIKGWKMLRKRKLWHYNK